MGHHAGAPLTESIDHAGFFIRRSLPIPGWMEDKWRRRVAWLWMVRGLFAVLYLLWDGRRLARRTDRRDWRAIEEFRYAVAPLVVFALLWLFADFLQPPNAGLTRARL